MQKQNGARGFTLLELMVSMAVGLIAMAAMAMLFKSGMNATMFVTQRIDTQENMRTGMDLMVKDISLAGAGLPSGGIQLPYGAGSSVSKYACDQTGTCHVPNDTYPAGSSNANFMYGIIPGYQDGVEGNASIPAAPSPAFSDSITVVYCDFNFPLWQYNVTFNAGTNGTQVTLVPAAGYTPASITSNGGLNQGDLIMISGGANTAVGEVTNYSASSGSPGATGAITFANADPLNINQSNPALSGNLNALAGSLAGAAGTAYRLFVVTYYLTVPPAGQTPRLMRQVNGLLPSPVADDIINLQFAYDNYNTSTEALDANQPNPLGSGESPNNIQKVNILMMGQSIINNQKNSQNLYLATDVSANNMAYKNPY